MKAARFAKHLQAHGIPVLSTLEGDESVDGEIVVTPLVHIQVPTFGYMVGVVAECDGGESFDFYPERRSSDITGIVADLRKACGMESANA